jgi:crotonobetainyl-CoA:carnitine CoA-transferase CaiB-like acyl-CoA transferase
MRAAAAERLGVGPHAVCARNVGIVYAYATGDRRDAAKSERPAFDDVIQGASGLAGLIGQANGEPRIVPYAPADKLCGVYLVAAIAAALLQRQRCVEGQIGHVPMLETMVAFNIVAHMWESTFTGRPEDAGYPRMLTPHRRPYSTKDEYVTDEQWRRLFFKRSTAQIWRKIRASTLVGRTRHIDELYAALGEEMKNCTVDGAARCSRRAQSPPTWHWISPSTLRRRQLA